MDFVKEILIDYIAMLQGRGGKENTVISST